MLIKEFIELRHESIYLHLNKKRLLETRLEIKDIMICEEYNSRSIFFIQ